MEPIVGELAADVQGEGVSAGWGYVDRVLEPLAGLDVVDDVAGGIARRHNDVDILAGAVLAAGVARRRIVIRHSLAPSVEVLGLERAGNREGRAGVRRLGGRTLAADRAGGGRRQRVH